MIERKYALAVCLGVLIFCALLMLPQVIDDRFSLTSPITYSFLGVIGSAATAMYVLFRER